MTNAMSENEAYIQSVMNQGAPAATNQQDMDYDESLFVEPDDYYTDAEYDYFSDRALDRYERWLGLD